MVTTASNFADAAACMLGSTCEYVSIVSVMLLWPRRSCTTWGVLAAYEEQRRA
jgi:hypothetical protein